MERRRQGRGLTEIGGAPGVVGWAKARHAKYQSTMPRKRAVPTKVCLDSDGGHASLRSALPTLRDRLRPPQLLRHPVGAVGAPAVGAIVGDVVAVLHDDE